MTRSLQREFYIIIKKIAKLEGRLAFTQVFITEKWSRGQKGEKESKRELVFLNAPETGNDPEKEIEQIKEKIPGLLETSNMMQDILRETLENT